MKRNPLAGIREESVIKKLRLPKARHSKKKFIILQIDGLSYSILKRFLDQHSCKFIRRLLNKEGYSLQKFNCGLPSGTPAVQAGIMYGDNRMLPAFRFVDKKLKRQFSMGNPIDSKFIEEKYFAHKEGILKGGASYSNHFSGGAERSILTMSTILKDKKMQRIKESDLWFLLLLYPKPALSVIYYSLSELILEIASMISYPFMWLFNRKQAIFGFWIPFRRLFVNAILTEFITLGIIVDVERGIPKIYANYVSFDEIGHLRGPNSTAAYFMIRALDRRLKKIYKKAKGKYDIFIISDHGQVDGIPFDKLTGFELSEYIHKCTKVESAGFSSAFEGRLTMTSIVMRKMVNIISDFSAPVRWIGNSFAKGVIKLLKPRTQDLIWKDKEQIFVSDSCCLANVYFNFSDERIDLSKINRKHPKIVDKLLKSDGIGIVMAKEGTDILLFGKGGKVVIGKNVKKEGRDFLSDYGNSDMLVSQIREFNLFEHVGDLTLFGNIVNKQVVSFTSHVGAHGGIGGDMMFPFFISKKKHDLSKVTNARELYKIFRAY